MSLRPIILLTALVAGLCLAIGAPIQATAETFMVVVNANNRVSGPESELRDLVRRVYLKQEMRWPSGLYSLPFARPAGSAETDAFAEAVLNMTPETLDAYWADQGKTPPSPIASARELFRQISRNKGAVSVVAGSEAEKLPAKVRVLFEFSPSLTPGEALAGSFDGPWLLEIQSDSSSGEPYRQVVEIVDNSFSAEVTISDSDNVWQGALTGGVDENGRLTGGGTLEQEGGVHGALQFIEFSTPETDGRFETKILTRLILITDPGHRYSVMKLSIRLTPQPPEASTAAAFDGEWLFEVLIDTQDGTASDRQVIQIVDDKFTAEVSTSGWRGTLSGQIDQTGTLVGKGLFEPLGSKYSDVYLNFSTPVKDGMFHTITVPKGGTQAITATITLTRQAGVAALSPPGEAPRSGAGSFDGEWIGRQGPWLATVRISGRNFDLEAKCEGTGYPIKGSVKGTLDEDGRAEAVLSPGTFRRTDIFGTFPQLQFFSNHSGCREVLVFKRAEAG